MLIYDCGEPYKHYVCSKWQIQHVQRDVAIICFKKCISYSISIHFQVTLGNPVGLINPLTSRPGCIPGSRYTGVGVLFFVI